MENQSKLSLEFTGESKRQFTLPLLDLTSTTPKEPKITFDAHIKMRGGSFKEILGDAGLLSSHLILQATETDFIIEAHGDSGDLSSVTKKTSSSVSQYEFTANARAMFPFEYLVDMTKSCPDDAVIDIWLKSDAPVKLSYSIGRASLTYYLAPRVDSE